MSGNAPKILIVVLVVIVVLFVVGVGVGASGGIGSISVDSVINTLAGVFPAPAVSPDEIDASPSGCYDRGLQRLVISEGGACELDIAESSANVRVLKLEIAAAGAVHLEQVVSPVEDQEMEVETDLPNDGERQLNLTFYPSGGSLQITQCVVNSGSACVINIVN